MTDAAKFAEVMFAYHLGEEEFGDLLIEGGLTDWSRIGGDSYDSSVEIYAVESDNRLNEMGQRACFDAGFCKAYLNHKDGWETHYSWKWDDFQVQRGWRRKRTETGFLIGYWPEGWGTQEEDRNGWLKSGYMTIVPDAAPTANADVVAATQPAQPPSPEIPLPQNPS